MQVKLIYITPDPEAHIGEQAAECYDSKTDLRPRASGGRDLATTAATWP